MEQYKGLIYNNVDMSAIFEISNFGNLRRTTTKRVLKPELLSSGYLSCRVTTGSRENKKHIILHKAVAETFLGQRYKGLEINHKNGKKTDNRVENLEYCTSHENQQHKYDIGLFDKRKISGVNNHAHKLTLEQVHFIRTNYKPFDRKYGSHALARFFGISHQQILKVIHNKSYTY